MHEKEYADSLDKTPDYRVWSIEHWLATQITGGKLELREPCRDAADQAYLLLPHCMEQTADRQSALDWETIFEYLGRCLTVKTAGCCGMSGLFGHERDNQKLSDDIFKLNWQGLASDRSAKILASGFSCRCQLQRHGIPVEHPLSVLSKLF